MQKKAKSTVRQLAYFSSVGLSLAVAIFLGLALGVYLDRLWQTSPWLTLGGLLVGIIAGYRNIGRAIRRARDL